jgi:hypothetical protein
MAHHRAYKKYVTENAATGRPGPKNRVTQKKHRNAKK